MRLTGHLHAARPPLAPGLLLLPLLALLALLGATPAEAAITTPLSRNGDFVEQNAEQTWCYFPTALDPETIDVACTGSEKGDYAAVMEAHLNRTTSINYFSASFTYLGGPEYVIGSIFGTGSEEEDDEVDEGLEDEPLDGEDEEETIPADEEDETNEDDETDGEDESADPDALDTDSAADGDETDPDAAADTTVPLWRRAAHRRAHPKRQSDPQQRRKVYMCLSGRAGDYSYQTMCTTVGRDNSLGASGPSPYCKVQTAQRRVSDGCYIPNQAKPSVVVIGPSATVRPAIHRTTLSGAGGAVTGLASSSELSGATGSAARVAPLMLVLSVTLFALL